jgi:hypothetical protein
MKKWFEFQEKFHKTNTLEKNKIDTSNLDNFVLLSIERQKIQPILNLAKKRLEKNQLRECLIFESKGYFEFIKTCYKNLTEIDDNELKQWLEDPEYSRLMITAGTELVMDIQEKRFLKPIIKSVSNYFNIDWETAELKLYVQLPGQMFPLHYDAFKSNIYTGSHNNEHKVKRWLIMLDDQMPGQCFLMGDTYMSWKQGDVIAWKNVELAHGSANFGYWPRFTLRITGELIS